MRLCSGALSDGDMARLGVLGRGLLPPASGSRWDPSFTTGKSPRTLPLAEDIRSFHSLPSYIHLQLVYKANGELEANLSKKQNERFKVQNNNAKG